jgi:hypothetical protein
MNTIVDVDIETDAIIYINDVLLCNLFCIL